MKRVINLFPIMCISFVVTFIGCKKEVTNNSAASPETNSKAKNGINQTSARVAPQKTTVSEYGFLIFNSHEEFEDYGDFMDNSTHEEVQKYHESINFISLGKSKYGESYASVKLKDDEQMDYTLNLNGIVQMNGVIMKPIEGNKFLLTLTKENLNSISYEHLVRGEYDRETMNKFATNRPKEAKIDLFEFIKQTPRGYVETQPNPTPEGKFWGKTCTQKSADIFNAETNEWTSVPYKECCKYRFWIEVGCAVE